MLLACYRLVELLALCRTAHCWLFNAGIILGIGGDNSDKGVGTFFEGAITRGYASEATDAAVQANIVAAGFGR